MHLLGETKSHWLKCHLSVTAACALDNTPQTRRALLSPEQESERLLAPAMNACTLTGEFATVIYPLRTHIDLEEKVTFEEIAFLATVVTNVAALQTALSQRRLSDGAMDVALHLAVREHSLHVALENGSLLHENLPRLLGSKPQNRHKDTCERDDDS